MVFALLFLITAPCAASELVLTAPEAPLIRPAAPELTGVGLLLPGNPSYERAVTGLLKPEPLGRPLEEALRAPARPVGGLLPAAAPPESPRRDRIFTPGEEEPWRRSSDGEASLFRLAYRLADALGLELLSEIVDGDEDPPSGKSVGRFSDFVSASHFEPATRTMVLASGRRLTARPIEEDGAWRFQRWSLPVHGKQAVTAVHLDTEAGLLATASGRGGAQVLTVGPEGPRGPPARLRPFSGLAWKADRRQQVTGIAYDARTQTLYLAGHGGTVEVRRYPPRPREAVLQRLRVATGGILIGAALDPASRSLIIAASNGQVETRRLEPDGRLPAQATAKVFIDHREEFERMSFDPASRRVLLGGRLGHGIAVVPLSEEGAPSLPARHVKGGNLASTEALAGDLVISAGYMLATHRLPAPPPETAPRWKGPFLSRFGGAVASGLSRGPSYLAGLLAETVHAVQDPAAVQDLWRLIAADLLSPGPGESRLRALRPNWAPGARRELAAKMPTLSALLADPAKVADLLAALGALRFLYPYTLANAAPLGALEWARTTGAVFPLGELVVIPVSESFRRHIIARADGAFAVELKLPGDQHHRSLIFDDHYTVARELWRESPEDPGVVRPLHFGRFAGRTRLYGQDFDFKSAEPLGLFVSEYEEGKRLWNSDAWIPEVARRLGQEPAQVLAAARADAAATAFRLHRLGWSGRSDKFTDMHPENVRLTARGRGVLVADFGALERRRLTYETRAEETLDLIGRPEPAAREELVPLVLERLAPPSATAAQRRALLGQVRRELGL